MFLKSKQDPNDVRIATIRGLKGSTSVNFSAIAQKSNEANQEIQSPIIKRSNSIGNLNEAWELPDNNQESFDEQFLPKTNFSLDKLILETPAEPSTLALKTSIDLKQLQTDIVFEENGRRLVVAGKIDNLVKLLCDQEYNDREQDYVTLFILTKEYHAQPQDILTKLIKLYDENSDVTVRNRTITVLKKWVRTLFVDFKHSSSLTDTLDTFKSKLPGDVKKNLEDDINYIKGSENRNRTLEPVPQPIKERNKTSTFLDFANPSDLARQITLTDHLFYQALPIHEFMKQKWNAENSTEVAPKLSQYIKNFNERSYWAATEIVFTPNLKQRVSVVKRMIHIAEKCLELNNFYSAMAIIAGLHQSSITRLRKTWKTLPSKFLDTFKKCTQLLSAEGNYRSYRSSLEKAVPPVNPYIGLYLKDLTFIEVGNVDQVNGLINFEKMRMIGNVYRDILKYQQVSYTFETNVIVQDYLEKSMKLTDTQLQKYSLLCEPVYATERKAN